MRDRAERPSALLAASTAMVAGLVTAAPAGAAPDSFFTYSGSDLASLKPGQVVRVAELTMHVQGNAMPISAVQLTYRTVDAQNRPVVNVTSVQTARRRRPEPGDRLPVVLRFAQSRGQPVAGHRGNGHRRRTGQFGRGRTHRSDADRRLHGDRRRHRRTKANFAAGPEYGTNTLDSIRAATRSPSRPASSRPRRSACSGTGGAIGTNWAAALAPNYAPDVNRRLVGAASGGLLVNPIRNLTYISGSKTWSGVAAMAIIGIARSYDVNFEIPQ